MSTFIAFVMDPMERVNPLHDTSFAFMLAARHAGSAYCTLPKDIDQSHQLTFRGRELKVTDRKTNFYEIVGSCGRRSRCESEPSKKSIPHSTRHISM